MDPWSAAPRDLGRRIRFVLTDVDDTLTRHGRLSGRTYAALERLHEAGLKVVPVTAAPAGWCDLMVRMWPVDAVIGENGGCGFVLDRAANRVARRYWLPEAELPAYRERLAAIVEPVVRRFPDAVLTHRGYREITAAIEFTSQAAGARDRAALREQLRQAGANATLNSIWVLAWLGGFDKLAMVQRMFDEVFGVDLEAARDAVLYVGDSVNDEPMFGFFPQSVGVSTVAAFLPEMTRPPRWITVGPGGDGFVEIAELLLGAR